MLRMGFRWYGSDNDSIPLAYIRQIPGVTQVVGALFDIPAGEVWPRERIAALKAEIEAGGNPKHAKVALAKEITARFHSAAAAEAAEQDFINRSKGGIPDDIPEISLSGAPLGIGALVKQANLAASTGEANRLIDGGGVRVDGNVISDRALKLDAGTFVLQVGKRKFARVTLS